MPASRTAPSTAQRAHAGIRDGILDGTYPAGSMLSENELAADLRMSRTPVRTALTRLQDEGWLTIYAQRGALVRDVTPGELRESCEFLHALQTSCIQRSGVQQRQAMAELLQVNLTGQLAALKAGRYSDFARLATEFHRAFVEIAGNSLMLAAYDRLSDRQSMVIGRSAGRLAAQPDEIVAEHRAMTEFARDGEWGAFSKALAQHLSLDVAGETRPGS